MTWNKWNDINQYIYKNTYKNTNPPPPQANTFYIAAKIGHSVCVDEIKIEFIYEDICKYTETNKSLECSFVK